jgi:DNA repair exonuclease SbcCD ATPase subunit
MANAITGIRPALAVLTIALTASGCASTGNDTAPSSWSLPAVFGGEPEQPLTPAEQRLREDNQIFNETVLGGIAYNALLGAAIAGAYGLLSSGGDLSQTATYAAVGAGAGGIYGAIDGYRTATKQEAARAQVREIDVMVDKVEAENARIEQSIQTTEVVIAETRARMEEAQARLHRQEITAAEFERDLQHAESNVEELDEMIAGIEKRQQEFGSVADAMRAEGEDTSQLQAQIAEGAQKLAQLQSERDLLAKDLEVSRIG